jgi:hypothetical protein
MYRTIAFALLVAALIGCGKTSPPVKTTTTVIDPEKKGEKPVKPIKPGIKEESPPTPGKVFNRPDDKEVEALKDTPTEELISKLADESERRAAARALTARGSDVAPELVKALESEDPHIRGEAAFVLGSLGKDAGDEAVVALKKLSETEQDAVVRDRAVFAIDAIEEK